MTDTTATNPYPPLSQSFTPDERIRAIQAYALSLMPIAREYLNDGTCANPVWRLATDIYDAAGWVYEWFEENYDGAAEAAAARADARLVDLGDQLAAAMAAERDAEARGAAQDEHDAALGLCRSLADAIAGLTATTLAGLRAKALGAEWELAVTGDCPEPVRALIENVKAIAAA